MSLYWPEYGVALELTDDVEATRFDRESHPDVTVIGMTTEELMDPAAFDEVAHELAAHMGVDLPEPTAEWIEANRNLRRALFEEGYGD